MIISLQNKIQHKQILLNNKMHFNFDRACFQGELLVQESMSRHTSWKTGGHADYFYRATDINDLSAFLANLPVSMPITWIGFGSNLLVRDGGIKGVVIAVKGVLDKLKLIDAGVMIGAGVLCAKAAHFTAEKGLSGVAFLAGIPGTIGGALAMNAGAYGREIWDYVSEVEMISRTGKRNRHAREQFDIAYRSVSMPVDEWFIGASLALEKSTKKIVTKSIHELLAKRAKTQPLGQYSCGSVFKNPPNDHAAKFIDDCGLKGKTIGGASVSKKHANFIINENNASSHDIEQLIKLIQATVFEKKGITLIPEVRIVGEEKRALNDENVT